MHYAIQIMKKSQLNNATDIYNRKIKNHTMRVFKLFMISFAFDNLKRTVYLFDQN